MLKQPHCFSCGPYDSHRWSMRKRLTTFITYERFTNRKGHLTDIKFTPLMLEEIDAPSERALTNAPMADKEFAKYI